MPVIDLAELLNQLTRAFGLSSGQLARALDVDTREVKRWYDGAHFPQGRSRVRLDELSQLANRLEETFSTGEAARSWLHSDNRYLGFMKPADALLVGRIDRVNAALEAIDSGYIS